MDQFKVGSYQWNDANIIPIINYYFNFWPNGSDKRWGELMWRLIAKRGLNYFETEEEEFLVRERVAALCLIYFELCSRSECESSDNFKTWSMDVRSTFVRETNFDTLNLRLSEIIDAIKSHYKSDGFIEDFIISATEGSKGLLLTINEKNNITTPHSSLSSFLSSEADDWEYYVCDPQLT